MKLGKKKKKEVPNSACVVCVDIKNKTNRLGNLCSFEEWARVIYTKNLVTKGHEKQAAEVVFNRAWTPEKMCVY